MKCNCGSEQCTGEHGGRASIVIGDTEVGIHNAHVFIQAMEKFGFKVYQVIKRPIPSKILPLTRDTADIILYVISYTLK
ncbi:MAG: hypothetical protein WCC17_20510 [Candidatus Nitrosopolaris sp.]